jgi:hypothetical protein
MHDSLSKLQDLADYVNGLETDRKINDKALEDLTDIIINALTIIRTIEDVALNPESTKDSLANMLSKVREVMEPKTRELYESDSFNEHIAQIDAEYESLAQQEREVLEFFAALIGESEEDAERDEDGYTEDENDDIEALLDDIREGIKNAGLRASDVGGFKFATADEFNSL